MSHVYLVWCRFQLISPSILQLQCMGKYLIIITPGAHLTAHSYTVIFNYTIRGDYPWQSVSTLHLITSGAYPNPPPNSPGADCCNWSIPCCTCIIARMASGLLITWRISSFCIWTNEITRLITWPCNHMTRCHIDMITSHDVLPLTICAAFLAYARNK